MPLIIEIREIDSSFIDSRSNRLKNMVSSLLRRNIRKAYRRADAIIVNGPEKAEMAAQITGSAKDIAVLPDDLDYELLFQEFRKIFSAIKPESEKE